MRNSLIAVVLLLSSVPFLSGCPKTPYGKVAEAGATIGTGIGQAEKDIDGIRVSGLITVAEEGHLLDYFQYANTANKAMLACAVAAKNSGSALGSFTACTTTFETALTDPTKLALIGVANPAAVTKIQTLSNTIVTGATALQAALGGA